MRKPLHDIVKRHLPSLPMPRRASLVEDLENFITDHVRGYERRQESHDARIKDRDTTINRLRAKMIYAQRKLTEGLGK